LLPRGACQTLLHSLVMPRIAAAVEAWDPTRETQPIHAWLHPWLPYLAPEMAAVYPTIRWVLAPKNFCAQHIRKQQSELAE